MTRPKVVLTDNSDSIPEAARTLFRGAGVEVVAADKPPSTDPVAAFKDADGLLVVWYPLTDEVLARLERCKVIVRCGVGWDNIDAAAARKRGIAVCNVPDYCIDEVSDHALSLALALGRELPALDRTVREGGWKSPISIPAFQDRTFATIGYGRIARAVLEKAKAFKFRLAAFDPYVPAAEMARAGVTSMSLDQVLREADILSLHSPLTPETRHLVNAERLAQMKPRAILVNTSRGPLVDTVALAAALQNGTIAAAGLDVFETEPLEADHPIRQCRNALLTPHYAWHSEASAARLYVMAAEEVLRGIKGEPLHSCVNKA